VSSDVYSLSDQSKSGVKDGEDIGVNLGTRGGFSGLGVRSGG